VNELQFRTVNELFDTYEDTLRKLTDYYALATPRLLRIRRLSVWFDVDCLCSRRRSRLLERQYRKSKLDADRQAWLTSDVDSRRRLRSASTAVLVVPRSKHSTIGDRAFPVAAAKIWNTLPVNVTSAPSLLSFKRRLKTELFKRCFASDSADI